jgi:hypothetical protein
MPRGADPPFAGLVPGQLRVEGEEVAQRLPVEVGNAPVGQTRGLTALVRGDAPIRGEQFGHGGKGPCHGSQSLVELAQCGRQQTANTIETTAEQYNSLIVEKTLVDRSASVAALPWRPLADTIRYGSQPHTDPAIWPPIRHQPGDLTPANPAR